jgi:hypothetical protein
MTPIDGAVYDAYAIPAIKGLLVFMVLAILFIIGNRVLIALRGRGAGQDDGQYYDDRQQR